MMRKNHPLCAEVCGSVADSEIAAHSFWSCFGRCFKKYGDRRKEQAYVAINAETERRIKEWIHSSSLCYGHESELHNISMCYGHESNVSEAENGPNTASWLACSNMKISRHPLHAANVTPTIASCKARNRNRWNGRLSFNQAEIKSACEPANQIAGSLTERVKMEVLPEPHDRIVVQPTSNYAQRRASARIESPLQSSTARYVSDGRVIWMRRSAIRHATQFEADMQPPAGPANS
jgi:hypothetical protein